MILNFWEEYLIIFHFILKKRWHFLYDGAEAGQLFEGRG